MHFLAIYFSGITLLSIIQRVYEFSSCAFRRCKSIIAVTVSLILTLCYYHAFRASFHYITRLPSSFCACNLP